MSCNAKYEPFLNLSNLLFTWAIRLALWIKNYLFAIFGKYPMVHVLTGSHSILFFSPFLAFQILVWTLFIATDYIFSWLTNNPLVIIVETQMKFLYSALWEDITFLNRTGTLSKSILTTIEFLTQPHNVTVRLIHVNMRYKYQIKMIFWKLEHMR